MKKSKKALSDLSLKADASMTHAILYLITNQNRKRNFTASLLGLLKGGILPASSFVIFHYGLQNAIQEEAYWRASVYVLIGICGIISSLYNVQDEIRQMLRTESILPWLYAILLEGNAMFVGGSFWENVISWTAFSSILLSNWVKMTYLSLLPKKK
jgi:hypothetical protein